MKQDLIEFDYAAHYNEKKYDFVSDIGHSVII